MFNTLYIVDPAMDILVLQNELQAEEESPYDSFITVFTKDGAAGVASGFKEGKSGQLSALLFCLENSRVYNDAVAEISEQDYGQTVIDDAKILSERMEEMDEEEDNPAIVQPIEFHTEG